MHLKCNFRFGTWLKLVDNLVSCSDSLRQYFIYTFRLPFDWRNPLGYTIAFIFQFILSMDLLITILSLTIYAIGTCLILMSLAEDIKCDLNSVKMNARHKKHSGNRLQMFVEFSHLIQFHSSSKQLSTNLNKFCPFDHWDFLFPC